MAWQPQAQGLQEILELLRNSTESQNNALHRHVNTRLAELNEHAEFNNYLIYILTKLVNEKEAIRAMAGLVLKNNVASSYSRFHPAVKAYIKENCLSSIGDPMTLVRSTVSNIITTIVTRGKLHDWPELLPSLIQRLESNQYEVLEGAFCALHHICEDTVTSDSGNNELFGHPLQVMLLTFIRFFGSPFDRVRMYAISCVTLFYQARPNHDFLRQHLNTFIQGLYDHAVDQSPDVRRIICQALVMLLEAHPDKLMPQLDTIIEYMIACTQDSEDSVALEACEFWLTVAEVDDARDALVPFLPRLVPMLLKRMVYSELDLQTLMSSRDDTSVPDRPEDIRPRFHSSRTHQQQHVHGDEVQRQPMSRGTNGEDADDDYDDDYDDDDGDIFAEWNIRKCSAAALDILATMYQNDILPHFLPILKEVLMSQDWTQRECGILALGAVAEGCASGMDAHLVELVPFLVSNLRDQRSLVRAISCWTISRYAYWVVRHKDRFFQPVLTELLDRLLDTSKRVQEAACSAFATLEEEANLSLIPYTEHILVRFMQAYQSYQKKNLVILYDAIATLADSVGENLNNPKLYQILMPPLISKWNALADDNPELFPLLESLSSVAMAMGPGFFPFAAPVFERSVRIIANTLVQLQEYEHLRRHGPKEVLEQRERPDKDFVIVSLDMLSGLAEGLGSSIESLVLASNPPLPNLIHQCLLFFQTSVPEVPEVRQSAFALLGDLTISCFPYMDRFLPEFIPILIKNLNPEHVSVCNNASWALGEVVLQLGPQAAPYANDIFANLLRILCRGPELPPISITLQENIAITVGRLGCVCPDVIAPHLQLFFLPWCDVVSKIRDNAEKASAFKGICNVIQLNPAAIVNFLPSFCIAVSSWSNPKPELASLFAQILNGYRTSLGASWPQFYNSLHEGLRNDLRAKYQLIG